MNSRRNQLKTVSRISVMCLLLLLAVTRAAVAETTVLQPVPKPGQIIHVTVTQESVIRPSNDSGGSAVTAVSLKSLLAFTQKNGTFDERGRLEAQLSIERLESEQSLNETMVRSERLDKSVREPVTATLDRAGRLVALTIPAELQSKRNLVQQLVAHGFGGSNFLPPDAVAVGDTRTTRVDVPMSINGGRTTIGVLSGARSDVTLREVQKGEDGRIAHVDVQMASGESDRLQLTGTAKVTVNLDQGFVANAVTEWAGNVVQVGQGTKADVVFRVLVTAK